MWVAGELDPITLEPFPQPEVQSPAQVIPLGPSSSLQQMSSCLGKRSKADAAKTDAVQQTASGESLMSPLPLIQPLSHYSITHVTFLVTRYVQS